MTIKNWTLNIPHLINATKKIANEINYAVTTLMGATADIELIFAVGSKGITLSLSAEHLGLTDHRMVAPDLCQEDHFSQPLRAALTDPQAQAWIRAAGTIAFSRSQAESAAAAQAPALTLVICKYQSTVNA